MFSPDQLVSTTLEMFHFFLKSGKAESINPLYHFNISANPNLNNHAHDLFLACPKILNYFCKLHISIYHQVKRHNRKILYSTLK